MRNSSALLKSLAFLAAVVVRPVCGDEPAPVAADAKPVEMEVAAEAPKPAMKKAVEVLNLNEVKAARRVAIKARPMGAIRINGAVQQQEVLTQQFLQRYRPVLVAELSVIRQTCDDLPEEQRPKIQAVAEGVLKAVATQAATGQLLPADLPEGVFVTSATSLTPQYIRDQMAKALQEHLTADQMTRYSQEAAVRAGGRKQAAILHFISHLDSQLYLSQEQREKIMNTFSSEWQNTWEKWTMYNQQYMPVVADQLLMPHLTETQQTVWQELQKAEMEWWGAAQNIAIDEWWGPQPANAVGVVQPLLPGF